MNYDESWLKITKAFPILIEKNEESESSEQDLEIAIKLINHLTINDHIEQLILINVEKEMRNDVVPKFWTKFKKVESPNERFKLFTEAVNELYDTISSYLPIFENIKKLRNGKSKCVYGKTDPLETFKIIVHSTLLSQLPLDYKEIVNSFYDISLRVFGDFNKSSVAEDGSICKHCNYEVENCQCRNIINNCHQINCKLIEMDLLERMVMQEVILLIYSRIENHVQETCKNNYDISFLCRLEDWLQTVVLSWLTQILCGSSSNTTDSLNEQMKDTIEKFKQKLMYFLHETYLKTIIDQLFYVIIEYPDSQPIIDDVRVCLPKTGLRSLLTSKLQQAFENRLLHQGVSTPDILTAYVTAIRALRRLDPTGVLLDTITEPVRKYLRSRDDTVRCIVSSLTEEGSSELADELVKGDALQLDDGCASDDENENWKTWMPDPIDADPTKTSKARRTSDIISMLVNVFGSKELFVNEYRTLLADRLLSQATCNTEKEIRYLELLKLRFGDSQLHYCEVMLKDIYDSKRINANLQNDSDYMAKKKEFPSTAMILSAQFWPPFKDDSLELLPEVKEQLDIYTKGFEALKGNRTLCWKTHLGTVDLEIELKDRTLNLSVSPMLATIIMHFQNKNEWTIEELYHSMKTPPVILRRKMAYWQTHGIIREENNKFILIEEEPDKNKGVPMTEMMCEEDETESAMASAHDQREEELQVFWSYIVGMLTNLEALPLDRIHQMLKMFASSEGPTAIECSMQELRTFLDGKVREHKLLFIGRYYRLP